MPAESTHASAAPGRLLRRTVVMLAAWIVLGEWLAPSLIRSLHASDASQWWPPLARAIERAQSRHDLAYYLSSWREDGRWAVLALLGVQVFALATRSARFVERFVRPATPTALGAIRAWVAGVLLASTLWEHLPSSALIPRGMIHGVGPVLGLLYALPIGFEAFVASPAALAAFQALTVALLAGAALGWRTRATVPLAAGAYTILAGILRQYAWFYHTGLVPLALLIVLAFTPCGDAFSLDRWLRVRRGRAVPDAQLARLDYGWGRFLIWIALALPYVEAGLSKLRRGGLDWPRPDNLKAILLVDTLNPMEFDWGVTLHLVRAPDALFWAIGLATLASEIGFGLVPFFRRARLALPLLMLGMHVGIWLLQNVLFFDLMLLQAIYYDWTWLQRWLAGRARVGPSLHASALGRAALAASGPTSARWPRRARVLVALLVTCWALRIEEFPFTAMQMYSKPNRSGEIDWFRVVATTESGETLRAPIETAIPALRDARYRRVIRQSFGGSESRALAEELLRVVLRTHNADRPAEGRLVGVETQRWHWAFARDPDDPSHGELAEVWSVRAAD